MWIPSHSLRITASLSSNVQTTNYSWTYRISDDDRGTLSVVVDHDLSKNWYLTPETNNNVTWNYRVNGRCTFRQNNMSEVLIHHRRFYCPKSLLSRVKPTIPIECRRTIKQFTRSFNFLQSLTHRDPLRHQEEQTTSQTWYEPTPLDAEKKNASLLSPTRIWRLHKDKSLLDNQEQWGLSRNPARPKKLTKFVKTMKNTRKLRYQPKVYSRDDRNL
jgi:hypothetical protein